jgi:hypothetical protein
MWDWLQRQDQRDRELDQGVDADLVQAASDDGNGVTSCMGFGYWVS